MGMLRPGERVIEYIEYGYAQAMIKEAKRLKLWINVEKEWFAPEEFMEFCKTKKMYDSSKLAIEQKDVRLRDPIPIIAKMREHLDKEEKKLSDFAMRVAKHYKGE